jgi:hypothetical protein
MLREAPDVGDPLTVCTGGSNDELRLEGSKNDDVPMGASDNCLLLESNEVCGFVESET